MEKGLIDVHVCYRDRPTEISLLLQSLRTQTYKKFRVFISDDASGTPLNNYHFLMCIINKLNDEGNHVNYSKNDFGLGVSKNRQKLINKSLQDRRAEFILRLDDDVILEPDYIEKLLKVIDQGYDLATGVTPFIGQAQFERMSKFIKPVGNRVILDAEGNFLYNGDDFGVLYFDEDIIPIHHFRSCALMKIELFDKISYNSKLTKHGFREEQLLSFKCMIEGFKMGVNTKAIAWHLLTPSGGERFSDSSELIKINEEQLKEFTKELVREHGDFIKKYDEMMKIDRSYLKGDLSRPLNCLV